MRSTTTALERLGLHVGPVAGNRLIVKVSSTAAIAERAFATTLVRYRLGSGALVYANLSAPRVPAALAGRIQAIAGLSDLALSHPAGLSRPGPPTSPRGRSSPAAGAVDTGGPQPCQEAASAASAAGIYTADELASAYGFSGLYAAGDLGAGETIAIFELEPFNESDVQAYDECYFPAQAAAMASTRHVLSVDGMSGGVPTDVESTLDVEDVSSFAPLATIDVYEGPNNVAGPLDVLSAIVSQDRAQVISTSWGNCEAQDGGSQIASVEANLFEEAAAQGQTVVAASGDDGSTDCGAPSGTQTPAAAVDDPGSQPYVTSVGGTSLTTLGPPPDRDRLEQLRRCQRGRHLVELGDACVPVGRLTVARGDQVVLLGQAVRRADRLLPGGPRRLGRCRPGHRPCDRLGRLGRLDCRGGHEPGGAAYGRR